MKSLYIVDDEFGLIISVYNLSMTPTCNNTKLRYLLHKQQQKN
jgi:hypothetical protein